MSTYEHQQIRLLLPAVALGNATEAEHAAAIAHVDECAVCEEQLMEFIETTAMLHMRAHPIQAPAHLRERVLAAVREERVRSLETIPTVRPVRWLKQRRWRMPALTAGSFTLAAAAASVVVMVLGPNSAPVPDARALSVQVAAGAPASLTGVDMRVSEGAVQVEDLPPAQEDRSWQLWEIDRQGATHSLGLVDGQTEQKISDRASLIAITDEPAGGSRQPSTQPVLTARI